MQSKLLLFILFTVTVCIAVISLGLGKFSIAPIQVIHVLMVGPSYSEVPTISAIQHQVVWDIRLPRILLALFAGGALSLSGATLQGVFRNPLVDPHIIGVTSGAAFGGTLAILLGFSPIELMLVSFLFGIVALILVYIIASFFYQKNNLFFVLSGVVLSGFFAALVSMMQYLSDTEEKLPTIIFWLMGSFSTASWHKFYMASVPFFIGCYFLLKLRWRINILSMGDDDAKAMGVNVTVIRWFILVACAVVVSAQVAVSGSIGWIGLVIPHLARMITGTDHRKLLPVAFFMGSSFMVIIDDIARLLTSSEVPLGIITALIGAPIFIFISARSLRGEKIA